MTGTEATAYDDGRWEIKHVTKQLYDLFTHLSYTATDVKMWGPALTDAQTVGEDEWRADFESVEPCEEPVIRAPLATRRTGYASLHRVQISWTEPDERRHTGWYNVPNPTRSSPKLRFP
jgi:hypothetical protein